MKYLKSHSQECVKASKAHMLTIQIKASAQLMLRLKFLLIRQVAIISACSSKKESLNYVKCHLEQQNFLSSWKGHKRTSATHLRDEWKGSENPSVKHLIMAKGTRRDIFDILLLYIVIIWHVLTFSVLLYQEEYWPISRRPYSWVTQIHKQRTLTVY